MSLELIRNVGGRGRALGLGAIVALALLGLRLGRDRGDCPGGHRRGAADDGSGRLVVQEGRRCWAADGLSVDQRRRAEPADRRGQRPGHALSGLV